MGLSASMWSGVSGLLSHGERMNVVGNNIANVNTLGFKGQRMDFQDFMYQDSYSASGLTQIGRGVTIGAVMGDFGQGSFETTTEVTDLAIGGRGFFKVKPQGTETEYFTRAGNFRFQNDGTLTNPQGFALQGWKIDNTQGPTRATGQQANSVNVSQIKGSGLPTDIKLDTWTVDPLQTTKIGMTVNLSTTACSDASVYLENPFASLLETWNGKQPPAPNSPPLAEEAYSYGVPVKVYDEAGGVHTLTMYLDKVGKDTYDSGGSNEEIYEYVLTMDPAEDMRRVAVPSTSWRPGADTTIPAGLNQPASSVFAKTPAAGGTWDANLKPGYTGTLNARYSFDKATVNAAPAGTMTYVDPTKPDTWPTDLFTGRNWPEPDAAGNPTTTIVDMKNTKQAGILMTGTITFNGQGDMVNQTAYVLNGNKKPIKNPNGGFSAGNGYVIDENGNPVPTINPSDPAASMYPTEVSSSGYPLIVGNFTGLPGADTVGSVPDADKYLMEVNLGLKVSNYKQPWQNYDSLASLKPQTTANKGYRGTDLNGDGNPVSGPEIYSASNRIANPNYRAGDAATGPQYLYANPYYDETLNTITKDATGQYSMVIRSPKYLYEPNYTAATPPVKLDYLSAPIPGGGFTPFTWNPATDNFPAALQGIVSVDQTTGKMVWATAGNATKAVLSDPTGLANMTEPPIKDKSAAFTNKTSGSNSTGNVSQNGYGRGELSSWTVSQDGVLSGIYSNGVTLPLYQVAIYDFTCKQGLRREGGNLFSETMESGQPSMGVGGANGLGTVNAQTLEGSNVDLSREFVNMITTQRGFQSNSKIITTVDTMLDVVVNMKR